MRVCEDAPCDGCEGVESFKAGLFVHPSQSHDQLTIATVAHLTSLPFKIMHGDEIMTITYTKGV